MRKSLIAVLVSAMFLLMITQSSWGEVYFTSTTGLVKEMKVGDSISANIGAADNADSGKSVIHFECKGDLPPGLTFAQEGEVAATIKGNALKAGTYSFKIIASSENPYSSPQSISHTITVKPNIDIKATLPNGVANLDYSGSIITTTAGAIISSVSGLPNGLNYDSSSGKITGSTTLDGTFTINVTAQKGTESDKNSFELYIAPMIAIYSDSFYVVAGKARTLQLIGYAYDSSALKWAVIGNFPNNYMTLDENTGTISGTLPNEATYTFTVIAKSVDDALVPAYKTITLEACPNGSYFAEGQSGNASDPYIINTIDALMILRNRLNTEQEYAKYYKLDFPGKKVDLSGYTNWTPIGTKITGNLDGNGHTVIMNVNNGQNDAALFGYINSVKNLNVTGTLKGCKVGGIAIKSYYIEDCSFSGTLCGSEIGGIVTVLQGGTITGCIVAEGSKIILNDSQEYAGGIVGTTSGYSSCTMENNEAYAEFFNVKDADCGGVIGYGKYLYYNKDNLYSGTDYGIGENATNSNRDQGCIYVGKLKVTTPSVLANATLWKDYTQLLSADLPAESWSMTSGTFPEGLSIDKYSSGRITGKPTKADTFKFTLTARKGKATASREFTLKVDEVNMTMEKIPLPSATVYESYSTQLISNMPGVTWETPAISWDIMGGDFPGGLTLDKSTGRISGTPHKAGSYSFTVTATRGTLSKSHVYSIVVNDINLQISSDQLPDVIVWNDYSVKIEVSEWDRYAKRNWKITGGSLPKGLELDGGYINGKPEEKGTFIFTVTVSDGDYSHEREFTINVLPDTYIAINSTNFPDSGFRSYVSNYCDVQPSDGKLSGVEISKVKTINVANRGITNLKGIEYFTSLTSLTCSNKDYYYKEGNKLTAIDVSHNVHLMYLDCSYNFIESLVLGSNPYLRDLNCLEQCAFSDWGDDTYYLQKVDVSGCPNLTTIHNDWYTEIVRTGGTILSVTKSSLATATCDKYYSDTLTANKSGSQWTLQAGEQLPYRLSLNASTGTLSGTPTKYGDYDFWVIASNGTVYSTKLMSVHVNRASIIAPPNSIAIDSTNFPDNAFRDFISANLDKNSDGYLVPNEIEQALRLGLNNKGIVNLKGIEHFTALTLLDCSDNSLTTLDLSKNTALQYLHCHSNSLSQLVLGRNTVLKTVVCLNNKLVSLNVAETPNLTVLEFDEGLQVIGWDNEPEPALATGIAINVENFPDDVFRKYITQNIDTDGNGYLSDEEISAVKELVFSERLMSLFYGGKLSSLKGIEYFTSLTYLSCFGNNLTELDISKNTALTELYCQNNQLTSLILGTNTALTALNCSGNQLTQLDISGCPNLKAENFTHDSSVNIINGTSTAKPAFKNFSLMMEGQIGVNFYALLPDISGVTYTPEKCWTTFNIRGDTSPTPQPLDYTFSTTISGQKYYGFRCYINAAQMADTITATLHYGNGQTITKDYSAKTYLNAALGISGFSQVDRNLFIAIKDYGHYIQPMLAKERGWVIGEKYLLMDAQTELTDSDINEARTALTGYAFSKELKGSGVASVSYSLTLGSETTINFYITPASGYSGNVGAYVDGGSANMAVKQSNGTYLVQISDIAAKNLGDMHTIKIVADKESTARISALSYAQAVLNITASQIGKVDIATMNKAVTALYKYYSAAKAYADK